MGVPAAAACAGTHAQALTHAYPPVHVDQKVEAGPRSKWELVRSRLQRHGGSGEQMRQLKRKTSQRKFNAFAAGGGRGNDSDGDDAAFALEDRAEEARKRCVPVGARATLCRLAELPLIWNRVLTVCACSMERSTARQERLLELQLEDAIHNADGACTWPPVAPVAAAGDATPGSCDRFA